MRLRAHADSIKCPSPEGGMRAWQLYTAEKTSRLQRRRRGRFSLPVSPSPVCLVCGRAAWCGNRKMRKQKVVKVVREEAAEEK